MVGGEAGIRTLGKVSPTHALQACPLNRSGTSPRYYFHLPGSMPPRRPSIHLKSSGYSRSRTISPYPRIVKRMHAVKSNQDRNVPLTRQEQCHEQGRISDGEAGILIGLFWNVLALEQVAA